jgi:LmbE family N-acetylglucosaminyl deacetylase
VSGIGAAGPALQGVDSVLVVCAHPDDESFGLGAVLSTLADAATPTSLLCFTHGEASTLHGVLGDLAAIRAKELADAAQVLGIGRAELLDYPDGSLDAQSPDELAGHVRRAVRAAGASTLLVFDQGGVTGHPDHQQATRAALAAAEAEDLQVLAWAIPDRVAAALNAAFGTRFVGRHARDLDVTLRVDRRRQLRAIACHASQASGNPVLWRRLELLGQAEHLRWLRTRPR